MTFTEWLETNFFEQDRRMVTAEMAFNAAQKLERKACAQVCGDRAKAASLACDAGAYYEAEECEDAILKRSNAEITGSALLRSPG